MNISQSLMEHALADYCSGANNLEQFSENTKEIASKIKINLDMLYEFCVYVVENYGYNVQSETLETVEKIYGYPLVDSTDISEIHKNIYMEVV